MKPNPSTITLPDLRDFCAQRIARYKAPRSLVIVDDLPRDSTGKVAKSALRRYGEQPDVQANAVTGGRYMSSSDPTTCHIINHR